MDDLNFFNSSIKTVETSLSPSQSWIVHNIHSIIQNNDDEEVLQSVTTPKLKPE